MKWNGLRRTPIKKRSKKEQEIKAYEKVLREHLNDHREHHICSICGRHERRFPYGLGLHHIETKGRMGRTINKPYNVLLLCWGFQDCCHDHAKYVDGTKYSTEEQLELARKLNEKWGIDPLVEL